MFLGRFEHVLDEKGRLAIPAKYRPELAEGLVITRGTDRCLNIYPLDAWNNIAARLDNLPDGDPNARNKRRAAFSAAEQVELDKQGRIVISERLRQYANLSSTVAVVGLNSYVEVWNLPDWEALENKVEEENGEIAANLAGQY